jgi:tetratricopeptide (TPR) repeat protein
VVEAALPLVEAAGHAEALCRLFNNLGDIYKRRGEFDQSRRWREQALDLAARISDPTHTQWALAALGELLFLRGDWAAARDHLERAVAVTGSVVWNLLSSFTFLALAQFHLAAGTWADATYCIEAGMRGGRRNRDLHLSIDVRRLLAERDLLEGRPEAVRQRLVPLLDHDGVIENSDGIHLLALLARAHLELGEVGPAAAVAARAVTRARAEHDRLSLVDALRVQALVATREEHWAEAACALEEGLALAQRMPAPVRAAPSIRQRSQGGHVGVALLTTSTTLDACAPGRPTGVRCTRCAHVTRVAMGARYRVSRPVAQSPLGCSRGEATGRHGHRVEAASSRGRLRPRRA